MWDLWYLSIGYGRNQMFLKKKNRDATLGYVYVAVNRVVRLCCMLQNEFLFHCKCILQILKMCRLSNSFALDEHFQKLMFGQQMSAFKYIYIKPLLLLNMPLNFLRLDNYLSLSLHYIQLSFLQLFDF